MTNHCFPRACWNSQGRGKHLNNKKETWFCYGISSSLVAEVNQIKVTKIFPRIFFLFRVLQTLLSWISLFRAAFLILIANFQDGSVFMSNGPRSQLWFKWTILIELRDFGSYTLVCQQLAVSSWSKTCSTISDTISLMASSTFPHTLLLKKHDFRVSFAWFSINSVIDINARRMDSSRWKLFSPHERPYLLH